MSAEENKQIVQKFYDASNGGDMEACFNLVSDEVVWTNIGTTSLSGVFRGKDELTGKLLGPLFGQLKAGIKMNVLRLIAEGDYVVAQASGEAETHDGRSYNNTYCWVIRLRGGKIVEVTEYIDTELVTSVFG